MFQGFILLWRQICNLISYDSVTGVFLNISLKIFQKFRNTLGDSLWSDLEFRNAFFKFQKPSLRWDLEDYPGHQIVFESVMKNNEV